MVDALSTEDEAQASSETVAARYSSAAPESRVSSTASWSMTDAGEGGRVRFSSALSFLRQGVLFLCFLFFVLLFLVFFLFLFGLFLFPNSLSFFSLIQNRGRDTPKSNLQSLMEEVSLLSSTSLYCLLKRSMT